MRGDGTIEPKRIRIGAGDTVEWSIPRGQAILPVGYDPQRNVARTRPFVGHTDDFTGPLVRAIPGIHTMNQPRDDVDPLPAWIWDEPGITCVYLRLEWETVNPTAGAYDWTELAGYMDQAVRSGKYFGVSVKAGVQATPRWIFSETLGDDTCEGIDFEGIARTQGIPWTPTSRGGTSGCWTPWRASSARTTDGGSGSPPSTSPEPTSTRPKRDSPTGSRVESAIESAWYNSDGIWLEVYDRDVKPSFNAGSGPLTPGGLTLAQWSKRFYDWRLERWGDELGDPFPATHRHTFPNPGTFAYVLGTRPESRGVVVVE